MSTNTTTSSIDQLILSLDTSSISATRKEVAAPFIAYLKEKKQKGERVQLVFVCTHNSRRSHLAQVWGKVMADHYAVAIDSYSGGMEVTECNPRTIASLRDLGFQITQEGDVNPMYHVKLPKGGELELFSKLYDDTYNPQDNFAAIMVCSTADVNCPFVAGAEKRIPLRFDDPSEFDNTPDELEGYNRRSLEIAGELKYIFESL